MAERLTEDDIACWVVKSRTAPAGLLADWSAGTTRELTRCLRRTYRLDLVEPGQLCLLWLSGKDRPGVQAVGRLTSGLSRAGEGDCSPQEQQVDVSWHLLREPVARADLMADPVFSGAEVLKMPLGSNPSYLTPEQLAALREHLAPEVLTAAGW